MTRAVHREGGPGLSRNRSFLLLWSGQSISELGSAISLIVLPLIAVTTLQASAFEIGLLAALEWLPWVLVGLAAGAWIDRARCRPVLVLTDLIRVVSLSSVPVAAAFGALTLAQLYAVALVTGLATVFFQVAYQSYLPVLVATDDLGAANARLQGTQAVSQIGGAGLGGALAQLVRAPYVLGLDAASYGLSAIALLAIRTPEPARAPREHPSLRAEIAEGARYVLADPLLRLFTLAPALSNLFFTGVGALQVLFLVRTIGLSPGSVGLLLSATGFGSVVGAALAGRLGRRFGTARTAWISAAVTVPFGLLIPLTEPGWREGLFFAGQFVTTAGVLVYNVTVPSWRQAYCPPRILGRVVASMRFVLFGTIPLGALLGGTLAGWLGIRNALWVLLIANLTSVAVLARPPLRGLRDLPTAPSAG